MGILAQCPVCKTRQSIKNKRCRKCDHNLDQAKMRNLVTYRISYRLPSGKQKQETTGTSIEEARAADGKKKAQKKEGRLFDIKPDSKMTFHELTAWYLGIEKVKARKSLWRTKISLNHFNTIYGDMIVSKIKPIDVRNYQVKRKKQGKADNTIDSEVGDVKAMVNMGFENDMVSGETLKTFKRVKKLLKRNANARDRILSHDEYEALCSVAPKHIRHAVMIGYHTGMPRGEILQLRWPMVNLKQQTITLEAHMTKNNKRRVIPISDLLLEVLKSITRAIHDDHVVLFRGKPLQTLGKALNRACDKANAGFARNPRIQKSGVRIQKKMTLEPKASDS